MILERVSSPSFPYPKGASIDNSSGINSIAGTMSGRTEAIDEVPAATFASVRDAHCELGESKGVRIVVENSCLMATCQKLHSQVQEIPRNVDHTR